MTEEDRYPLVWPSGWKRTLPEQRIDAPFKVTPDRAQRELMAELNRLGATRVILSTNVQLRQDGLPYANRTAPSDGGVAVYFRRKGKDAVFACDQYRRVHDNMRAIGKSIEALRGIERWGASDMLDRAFTGFEALPAPEQPWQVLGVAPGATRDQINSAWRQLAKESDNRGSDAAMARLNVARDSMIGALDHRS